MPRNAFRLRLLPVPALICALLPACDRVAAADDCTSAACHATLVAAKTVHPAAEACDTCHEATDPQHPQPGKQTFKLVVQPPELCAACHDAVVTKSHVHPPVQEGMCTTCHDPHASEQPKLLVQPIGDLCQACHDTVLTKNMTVLHGPINEGTCTACHDPHSSEGSRLLVEEFPPDAYVPYTDTSFTLCFSCHDRDLVREPTTSKATNFRDGERNLHYLHVNDAQKGRSCKLCHEIHGGRNAVLIADSVQFGSWRLPLRFAKTESGGGCAPGCHKPQQYER